MSSLAATVVSRLAAGRPLIGLGLRTVEGRWDLRGLRFPEADRRPGPEVAGFETGLVNPVRMRNVELDSLDFSGAVWRGLSLTTARVTNCVFDDADFSGLNVQGVQFIDCSFRGADVRDASLCGNPRYFVGWRRLTSWTRVDFTGSDLRGTAHLAERYVDCDFSNARLDRVDFDAARHTRSRFSGRLEEVEFSRTSRWLMWRGSVNTMFGVDFSRADLVDCGFWALDLAHAVLPVTAQHAVFAPKVAVAKRVLQLLRNEDDPGALIDLRVRMERCVDEGPATLSARGVAHEEGLGRDLAERARAMGLIRRAQSEVGGR